MAKYENATAEGFSEYWILRGQSIDPTWDEDAIDAALLIASEYIDYRYEDYFVGRKTGGFPQVRSWPRTEAAILDPRYSYVFAVTEIPSQVIEAVYEIAFRELKTPGQLFVDFTPNKYKSVSIDGALSVDYRQFQFASEAQKDFPIVGRILNLLFRREDVQRSIYSGNTSRV